MNTKQALLESMHLTPMMQDLVPRINFARIESFVWNRLSSFVDSRGPDTVRYDLNYDVETPTDAFIVNLMETGSVQLLQENGLEQDNRFIDALHVIIAAINKAIAGFLQQTKIAELASYCYAGADPQFVILERAVEQVEERYHKSSRFLIVAM